MDVQIDDMHEMSVERERALPAALVRLSSQAERFAPYIAAMILFGIFVVATVKSFYRPVWFDEILTILIAKLPTTSDIVSCTKAAPDGQPILYYWIVRASIKVFGSDAWGLRAPSTAGYILFCFSLYWFVSRQTSKLYGLIALLIPTITNCWYYATEGRPYGLVMGFAGMAAVSWQSIAMNRSRKIAIAGLGLSLLGAFSVHYFATLLFVPFATAEAIRTLSRRKVDLPVWASLGLPFSILIPYLPIMAATHANAGAGTPSFASPGWYGSLATFTLQFLEPALPALVGVACIYVIFRSFMGSGDLPGYPPEQKDLLPYTALVLPLTCVLPFVGIALGKFVTHQFFPRYVIGSMFGIAALITLVTWFAFSRRREPAFIVAVLVAGFVCHTAAFDLQTARTERANPIAARTRDRIPAKGRDDKLPIVVADVIRFLDFRYYGDPALFRRMYYVSSEASALRVLGFTIAERLIMRSAPYFGTQVVDYETWMRSHSVFYVLGGPDWLVPRLLDEGAHVQMLQSGADPFYRVTLPSSVSK